MTGMFVIPKARPNEVATICMFLALQQNPTSCDIDPKGCSLNKLGGVSEYGKGFTVSELTAPLCPKKCWKILEKMVEKGKLAKDGELYTLKTVMDERTKAFILGFSIFTRNRIF